MNLSTCTLRNGSDFHVITEHVIQYIGGFGVIFTYIGLVSSLKKLFAGFISLYGHSIPRKTRSAIGHDAGRRLEIFFVNFLG